MVNLTKFITPRKKAKKPKIRKNDIPRRPNKVFDQIYTPPRKKAKKPKSRKNDISRRPNKVFDQIYTPPQKKSQKVEKTTSQDPK